MFHKTERAMQALKKRNEELGIKTVADTEEPVELEKGDLPAMLISAFITILPAAILVLALVVGIPVLILWLLSL